MKAFLILLTLLNLATTYGECVFDRLDNELPLNIEKLILSKGYSIVQGYGSYQLFEVGTVVAPNSNTLDIYFENSEKLSFHLDGISEANTYEGLMGVLPQCSRLQNFIIKGELKDISCNVNRNRLECLYNFSNRLISKKKIKKRFRIIPKLICDNRDLNDYQLLHLRRPSLIGGPFDSYDSIGSAKAIFSLSCH